MRAHAKQPDGGTRLEELELVEFPEPTATVKPYYKYELARLYKFSQETLLKFLNDRFRNQFEALGYRPNDKLLTKQQVRLLFDLIGAP